MNTPSTVADTLDAAAALLSKPGAWTQHYSFRKKDGRPTEAASASCMCLLGAIWLSGGTVDGPETMFLKNYLDQWPADWNDEPERTQDEVVAILHEAAAKARGEVQP